MKIATREANIFIAMHNVQRTLEGGGAIGNRLRGGGGIQRILMIPNLSQIPFKNTVILNRFKVIRGFYKRSVSLGIYFCFSS